MHVTTHKLLTYSGENVTWLQSEGDVFPVAVDITARFDIIPWQKVIVAAIKYGVCW